MSLEFHIELSELHTLCGTARLEKKLFANDYAFAKRYNCE